MILIAWSLLISSLLSVSKVKRIGDTSMLVGSTIVKLVGSVIVVKLVGFGHSKQACGIDRLFVFFSVGLRRCVFFGGVVFPGLSLYKAGRKSTRKKNPWCNLAKQPKLLTPIVMCTGGLSLYKLVGNQPERKTLTIISQNISARVEREREREMLEY